MCYYKVLCCKNFLQIKFFEENFWPLRALPPRVLKILTSPRQRRHQTNDFWELGNGSRTRRCGWSVWSFHVKGEALRKNGNSHFFSVACMENSKWRKFCFQLFFLRHREWVYQACLVCERPGRLNRAALLTSAVANKPLREEAIFIHKKSSQRSRHCKTNWASKTSGTTVMLSKRFAP